MLSIPTLLVLASAVFLLWRGSLSWALFALPAACYLRWTGASEFEVISRTTGWQLSTAAIVVLWAILFWPWFRARTLGRRAYARSLKTHDLSIRDQRLEPSEFERWVAAGRPWRGSKVHGREALEGRPETAEKDLEAFLFSVDAREFMGAIDLAQSEWESLASTGLLGAGIDSKYGGLGLDPLAHSDLVARSAGRAIPIAEAIAESGPGSFADLVSTFGTTEQREHLLEKLARGETLGAAAWTGIDLLPGEGTATITSTGKEGARKLRVSLRFAFDAVENAPRAGYIAVVLPTFDPDGLLLKSGDQALPNTADHDTGSSPLEPFVGTTCFLVPADAEGMELPSHNARVGVSSLIGTVRTRETELSIEAVLGGSDAIGHGDFVRGIIQERRAGWRGAAIACGIAEFAGRVAGNIAAVDVERRHTQDAALGTIAANVANIDALRLPLVCGSARLSTGLSCVPSVTTRCSSRARHSNSRSK